MGDKKNTAGIHWMILGTLAATLGLVRLVVEDGGDRWTGLIALVVGLSFLSGGFAERRTAKVVGQTRAALAVGSSAVLLTDAGPRRTAVIGVLRSSLALDLSEATRSVGSPVSVPVSGIDRATAESVVERLRDAGATAEVIDSPRSAEHRVQ